MPFTFVYVCLGGDDPTQVIIGRSFTACGTETDTCNASRMAFILILYQAVSKVAVNFLDDELSLFKLFPEVLKVAASLR